MNGHKNSFKACAGFMGDEIKPALGNWTRAEQYAHDIIEVSFFEFSLIAFLGFESLV